MLQRKFIVDNFIVDFFSIDKFFNKFFESQWPLLVFFEVFTKTQVLVRLKIEYFVKKKQAQF